MPKRKYHKIMKTDESSFTLTPRDVFKDYNVTVDQLKDLYNNREVRSITRTIKKRNQFGRVVLATEVFFQEEQIAKLFTKTNDVTVDQLKEMTKKEINGKKLTYKGYRTEVNLSEEDLILHGKIENPENNDLWSFEGKTINEFEKAFKEAVDEYLEFLNKEKEDEK